MADDDNKCKNAPCSCPRSEESKYCSTNCEGKGDMVELDCECGHPECAGNF